MNEIFLKIVRAREESRRATQAIAKAPAAPLPPPVQAIISPSEIKRPDMQSGIPKTPSVSLEKRTATNTTELIFPDDNSLAKSLAPESSAKPESGVNEKISPSVDAPEEQSVAKPGYQNKRPTSAQEVLAKLALRRQDCGGAGNNCLLLSIAYQLFPEARENWQVRMAKASEMRKMILEYIGADLASCKGQLNELENKANLSETEITEKKNLSSKIKKLNELQQDSSGAEPLRDEVAYYVAKHYGKDIFFVSDGYRNEPDAPGTSIGTNDCDYRRFTYYPCDMRTFLDTESPSLEGMFSSDGNVISAMKQKYVDGSISIYGHPGHYQALVHAK